MIERLPQYVLDATREYQIERQHSRTRTTGEVPENGSAESGIQAVPKFPMIGPAAFYGLPGEIIKTLEPITESDPNGLLLTLHAFFGNAIGRGPYYQVEGDRHGPNIFALLVGDTAKARKGTGAGRIKQLFRVADENWLKTRVHTGLSSGEGVISEVRDRVTKLENGEEKETDPGVIDKRLMILESEFAGALKAMERDGNILSRVLRDAWDGDMPLGTLTKSFKTRATGACISIVGHITGSELRRYLKATEAGNGFGNRILFGCVRRARELPFGGHLSEERICELGGCIEKKIRRARSIDGVAMAPDAQRLWRDVYHELSEGRPGLLGALTARAEAQVVRLALLYALWDDPPCNGRLSELIELPHLQAALAIWDYCEQSVRYLFGNALGDPVADRIFERLKQVAPGSLSLTDIHGLFSRHVGAGEVTRALEELARLNLAIRSSAMTNGRPAEIWTYRCEESELSELSREHGGLSSHNSLLSRRQMCSTGA